MRVTIVVVMILVVVVTFFQSLITSHKNDGLCHTLYFIIPSTVNQIVNIFFVIVGIRITRSIQLFNKNQQRIIEGEETLENQAVIRTKQEIRHRQKSINHMQIIIGCYFFFSTWETLYNVILYYFSNHICKVQDKYMWLQSITEIFARSTTNVWWAVPIIWMFWPTNWFVRSRAQSRAASILLG